MKKGFSLVELIISIGLISVIFVTFIVIKNTNTTYADPYENVRSIIADATNVFLNTNIGSNYKKELNEKKEIEINTNLLIYEGLLNEEYYVNNINDNINIKNLEIKIYLDDEGIVKFSINLPQTS